MKTDLDKLLKGEPIYRHEDQRIAADKWDGIATFMQMSSVFALFPIIFILNALPKSQAKVVVWYLVIPLFIYGTIAFFVARKALKHRMTYLNAEGSRVSELLDQAIKKVNKE